MKKWIMLSGLLATWFTSRAQADEFSKWPVYNGQDLGLQPMKKGFSFRLWSPSADTAELLCWEAEKGGEPLDIIRLQKSAKGTWFTPVPESWHRKFYTVRVCINGRWSKDVTDPYVKAVGINGQRGYISNPATANPPGWEKDRSPVFRNPTDAIIYELHVRDASIHRSSGIEQKGKYLGLTERGTRNSSGASTGLDHIRSLGVTHVHLLPVFDFNSVDEAATNPRYNWGYDPLNYNVPEGSYATSLADPLTRNREFKELVMAFHTAGLRVVMDVVYNHTALTESSNFNQLVPGYYYRQKKDGSFSNASACGNETASERPMFRKFMLESMLYWVQEYHVDGFRIDLMGIHDITTINEISKTLHRIKPGILLYGEGWTAGASPLPDSLRALKQNAAKLDRVAVFSDDLRDGIKGSVFEHKDPGFASGKKGMEQSIRFGVVAACPHPQVEYTKVNYSKKPWAAEPWQTISYCECHDNHVLRDKLKLSAPDATETQRKEMVRLALSIVLTSQGIAFLHAGTEMYRTKYGVENSFESSDSINAIDWNNATSEAELVAYVRNLISLRKAHPAFRMKEAASIARAIQFSDSPPGTVVYTINGTLAGDHWKQIAIYYNGSAIKQQFTLPEKQWKVQLLNNRFVEPRTAGSEFELAPFSCAIFYQE